MCKRPDCDQIDPQVIRLVLSALAGIEEKHITVSALGRPEDDRCCVLYAINIAAEKGTFDVQAAQTNLESALASNDEFSVETEESSNASALVLSLMLIALCIMLLI
jgi:hypothetical protein